MKFQGGPNSNHICEGDSCRKIINGAMCYPCTIRAHLLMWLDLAWFGRLTFSEVATLKMFLQEKVRELPPLTPWPAEYTDDKKTRKGVKSDYPDLKSKTALRLSIVNQIRIYEKTNPPVRFTPPKTN